MRGFFIIMTYIDFHTHAFADSIAARAIEKLSAVSHFTPYSDGTVKGLQKVLAEDGITKAVMLPIATKPSQQHTINDISIALNSDGFICFGSIHPESTDWQEELIRLKYHGIKGIKLHPDYQGFFVDDEKLDKIYSFCEEQGIIIVLHAGFDPLSPELIHCRPQASAKTAKRFPKLKLVLAHLGGMNIFEESLEYLAGIRNVWLDTAFLAGRIENSLLEAVIMKHGADRILLGSDMPWQRPKDSIKQISSLNISDEEKELIFHKTAENLLCR